MRTRYWHLSEPPPVEVSATSGHLAEPRRAGLLAKSTAQIGASWALVDGGNVVLGYNYVLSLRHLDELVDRLRGFDEFGPTECASTSSFVLDLSE